MYNYPRDVAKPCSDIFLLNTTCNDHGHCLNNNTYCSCETYYNPLKNCSTTLYDDFYNSSIGYSAISILGCIFLILVFGIEIFFDCSRKKTVTVIYSKCMIIIYAVMKMITTILFLCGFGSNSNLFTSSELVMQIIAITSFGLCCFTTTVEWFSLILKVKNLGLRPGPIRVFRILIILVMALFFTPVMIIGIFNALNLFSLATYDSVILITGIFIIEAIIWVYIIKAFCWFRHIKLTNDSIMESPKYRVFRKKTIILLICNVYIIILNSFVPLLNIFPKELLAVVMLRKWVNLFMEFSTLSIIWLFLQNHTIRESNINKSTKTSELTTTPVTSNKTVATTTQDIISIN